MSSARVKRACPAHSGSLVPRLVHRRLLLQHAIPDDDRVTKRHYSMRILAYRTFLPHTRCSIQTASRPVVNPAAFFGFPGAAPDSSHGARHRIAIGRVPYSVCLRRLQSRPSPVAPSRSPTPIHGVLQRLPRLERRRSGRRYRNGLAGPRVASSTGRPGSGAETPESRQPDILSIGKRLADDDKHAVHGIPCSAFAQPRAGSQTVGHLRLVHVLTSRRDAVPFRHPRTAHRPISDTDYHECLPAATPATPVRDHSDVADPPVSADRRLRSRPRVGFPVRPGPPPCVQVAHQFGDQLRRHPPELRFPLFRQV